MMTRPLVVLMGVLLGGTIVAQDSPNYRLSDHSFNAGGHLRLASASHRITFVGVGEPVGGTQLTSLSYRMDAGLVASYPPPREVVGLHFTDSQTLQWDPERSTGSYNLYRGLLSDFDPLRYGACEQRGLTAAATTDAATPPSGDGHFYLVTAVNRLGEEGTTGTGAGGTERPNPEPCP